MIKKIRILPNLFQFNLSQRSSEIKTNDILKSHDDIISENVENSSIESNQKVQKINVLSDNIISSDDIKTTQSIISKKNNNIIKNEDENENENENENKSENEYENENENDSIGKNINIHVNENYYQNKCNNYSNEMVTNITAIPNTTENISTQRKIRNSTNVNNVNNNNFVKNDVKKNLNSSSFRIISGSNFNKSKKKNLNIKFSNSKQNSVNNKRNLYCNINKPYNNENIYIKNKNKEEFINNNCSTKQKNSYKTIKENCQDINTHNHIDIKKQININSCLSSSFPPYSSKLVNNNNSNASSLPSFNKKLKNSLKNFKMFYTTDDKNIDILNSKNLHNNIYSITPNINMNKSLNNNNNNENNSNENKAKININNKCNGSSYLLTNEDKYETSKMDSLLPNNNKKYIEEYDMLNNENISLSKSMLMNYKFPLTSSTTVITNIDEDEKQSMVNLNKAIENQKDQCRNDIKPKEILKNGHEKNYSFEEMTPPTSSIFLYPLKKDITKGDTDDDNLKRRDSAIGLEDLNIERAKFIISLSNVDEEVESENEIVLNKVSDNYNLQNEIESSKMKILNNEAKKKNLTNEKVLKNKKSVTSSLDKKAEKVATFQINDDSDEDENNKISNSNIIKKENHNNYIDLNCNPKTNKSDEKIILNIENSQNNEKYDYLNNKTKQETTSPDLVTIMDSKEKIRLENSNEIKGKNSIKLENEEKQINEVKINLNDAKTKVEESKHNEIIKSDYCFPLTLLKPILKNKSSEKINNFEKQQHQSHQSHQNNYKRKCKKSVRFKSENEECPFKKFECPHNVINLPIYIVDSKLEPFLEARLIKMKDFPDFDSNTVNTKNVAVESIGLLDVTDQEHDILRIKIQVKNLAFEKKVNVHATFNSWETVEIFEAKYKSTINNYGFADIDRFYVDIDTDCDGESVCNLQFAIQYRVAEKEFWDNNNGKNYSLKVDRTVRIPAKEIKSHPFYEGPVTRYKIKPGYNYPYSKNDNSGQLSAALPIKSSNMNNTNNHIIKTKDKQNRSNEIIEKNYSNYELFGSCTEMSSKKFENNDISISQENDLHVNNKGVKSSIQNLNSAIENFEDSKDKGEIIKINNDIGKMNENIDENTSQSTDQEETSISTENDDSDNSEDVSINYFSWNEPILLRYSSDRSTSSINKNENINLNNSSISQTNNENNIKGTDENLVKDLNKYTNIYNSDKLFPSQTRINENQNEPSNYYSSSLSNNTFSSLNNSVSIPMSSSSSSSSSSINSSPVSSFSLPKQSWFKEAPLCLPYSSTSHNFYHHPNNYKQFVLKNSISNNTNNTTSSSTTTSITTEISTCNNTNNFISHNNDMNNNDCCNNSINNSKINSNNDEKTNKKYVSSIYSSSSSSKYMNNSDSTSYLYNDSNDYNQSFAIRNNIYNNMNDFYSLGKYPTSHLYATQDDFSFDSTVYY